MDRNSARMACASVPFIHEIIDGKVCMAQNLQGFSTAKKFRCFQPQETLRYQPFCDDFGPMNLASITRFIELLEGEISSFPECKIIYCVDEGKRALTNAVFLLGSYMILKLDMTSVSVLDCFNWLDDTMIEPFRDATYSTPDFGLTLLDCWMGLERGKSLGWVQPESSPGIWGQIDVYEYEHYDEPRNGDLHMVVPSRFIAFRGPTDLGGGEYRDTNGYRQFSPQYYAELFRDFGVTAVVRLNEPEYEPEDFERGGIRHYDLAFEDCTAPPARVVKAFFAAVDAAAAAGGVVAVHCRAGLGRTGTLIALDMMRTHRFTAREAMGWLRIMRPGSVIGEQQHYLAALDAPPAALPAAGEPQAAAAAEAAPAAAHGKGGAWDKDWDGARRACGGGADPAALAAQVAAGMERRAGGGGAAARPLVLATGADSEEDPPANGRPAAGRRDPIDSDTMRMLQRLQQ